MHACLYLIHSIGLQPLAAQERTHPLHALSSPFEAELLALQILAAPSNSNSQLMRERSKPPWSAQARRQHAPRSSPGRARAGVASEGEGDVQGARTAMISSVVSVSVARADPSASRGSSPRVIRHCRTGCSPLHVQVRLSVVSTGTATVSTGMLGRYLATRRAVEPPRVSTTISDACTWLHPKGLCHSSRRVTICC